VVLITTAVSSTGVRGQALPTSEERAVLDAQAQRFRATIAKDVTRLDTLLADELAYGHSNGLVDGKRWYLDAAKGGRYLDFVPEGMKVQIYGEAAVITGQLDVKSANGQRKFRTIEVHVKRGGRWQLAHVQFTSLM
jgi:hypothetical protein